MFRNNIAAGILAFMIILLTLQTGTTELTKKYGIVPNVPAVSEFNAEDYNTLNSFSTALWSEIAAGKNEIFSPLSAYLALAMCANGAEGATLEAFAALGFTGNEINSANEAVRALIARLTDTEGSTSLNIANSIWVDSGFEVNKEFLQVLVNYYSADAFSANLPKSVDKVNSWIEEKTNGIIKDMLDEINEDTVSLLINAIYMNAKFRVPFKKEATQEDYFYGQNGEKVLTDFMNRLSYERVIDTENAIGIVLPYDDGKLEFVALMPKDETATTVELIKSLTGDSEIGKLAKNAEQMYVKLSIPKFESNSTINLNNALKQLGMEIAFTDYADFSGIGKAKNSQTLSIGEVLQTAYLKLDESGTEAAAATVITIETTSLITETPEEIIFNRPFIYAVIDSESGAILFCGEYNTVS